MSGKIFQYSQRAIHAFTPELVCPITSLAAPENESRRGFWVENNQPLAVKIGIFTE